jgi:hypothetical protein
VLAAIVGLTAAVAAGTAVLVVQLSDDDSPGTQVNSPEPTGGQGISDPVTAETRAELAGQQYMYDFAAMNPTSDEHAALTEGYAPHCEAQEESDLGWLVHCELRNPNGSVFDRAFDVVVAPDGTVSANAGGS